MRWFETSDHIDYPKFMRNQSKKKRPADQKLILSIVKETQAVALRSVFPGFF
jgi:hypothetical protein